MTARSSIGDVRDCTRGWSSVWGSGGCPAMAPPGPVWAPAAASASSRSLRPLDAEVPADRLRPQPTHTLVGVQADDVEVGVGRHRDGPHVGEPQIAGRSVEQGSLVVADQVFRLNDNRTWLDRNSWRLSRVIFPVAPVPSDGAGGFERGEQLRDIRSVTSDCASAPSRSRLGCRFGAARVSERSGTWRRHQWRCV